MILYLSFRVPEGSSGESLGIFGAPRGASGNFEEHVAQRFALYDLFLGVELCLEGSLGVFLGSFSAHLGFLRAPLADIW